MKMTSLVEEWQNALDLEIAHMKKRETTGVFIEEGRCLRKDDSVFIYWFTLSFAAMFPEGCSVIFKAGKRILSGTVISSEERECIVELDQFIGDPVTGGQLIYEPWELLEKLSLRLDEVKERHEKTSRIKNLVFPMKKTLHQMTSFKSTLHEAYIRSKYNPVTYLWGPPGTGKTFTLARVAAYHYNSGKRVLLLSHSNAAVDVLIQEMFLFLSDHNRWSKGDVLRYGSSRKTYGDRMNDLNVMKLLEEKEPHLAQEKDKVEEYRRKLKKKLSKSFSHYDSERLSQLELHYQKLKERFKSQEGGLVNDARVIGTTLSKAAIDPLIYNEQFDVVIVDEASMAYVPQVAFAASLAEKTVICGDFKQLPPIAGSYHPLVSKWLKEDIFHVAKVADSVEKGMDHPQLLLLPEQRRMHPSISAFTNRYIYHSKVGDHPDVAEGRAHILSKQPYPGKGSILLSLQEGTEWVETERGSRWNILSSFITLMMAMKALHDGVRSIGIATPYRSQAIWYNILLQDLVEPLYQSEQPSIYAATVHSFQGSENDIILFDLVDGEAHGKPGALMTRKGSERLINVAVTRARGKFILIGDDGFMKRKTHPSKTIHQLIDYLQKDGSVAKGNEINESELIQSKKFKWYPIDDQKRIIRDLRACKEEIIVNATHFSDIPPEIVKVLNEMKSKITIKILCDQGTVGTSEPSANKVPFISMDKKVLWFNCFKTPGRKRYPYQIRVFSRVVHQHFKKMINEPLLSS
ncbi:DNA2/NAM7 family helicase [Rossellomorea aquimaris]|uniref:AAA domain-containing protein n=1 Tax=Rossellomorea aquimaris TaxID=189382 RepID=UPI001CD1CF10|nr:AAA domain-containing protein [Rossellomorea aquimaris]MCA1053825.1 DNA2/NAM7 family helicase [Rossellomorea aquimaris]